MFSSGGPSVRFLTMYDGEVSEPLVHWTAREVPKTGFLGTLTSEPLSQLSPLKPELMSTGMPLHRGTVTDGRHRRHSQPTTACLAPGDVTRGVAEFPVHVQPSP